MFKHHGIDGLPMHLCCAIGLKGLWRTASVDGVSEADIEQYLKNGNVALSVQF